MSAVDTRPGYLVVYAAKGFDTTYNVTTVFDLTAEKLAEHTAHGDVKVSGLPAVSIQVLIVGAGLVCTIPAVTLAALPTLSTHRIWITKDGVRTAVVAGPVIQTDI
jgi:hypothetical protein